MANSCSDIVFEATRTNVMDQKEPWARSHRTQILSPVVLWQIAAFQFFYFVYIYIYIYIYIILFIYLTVLGLCCCMGFL